MIDEVQYILDNAKKVGEGNKSQLPMLLLISNGMGTGWDERTWRSAQKNYLKDVAHGSYIEYDCPHYIHDYVYGDLSVHMRDFINTIEG